MHEMVPSRVIAAVLLLVAGAQCADPALASNLGVNGLERASDLASAPFPADGAFVLSWCSKCPAAGCRGFEVQLVDEQTAFPQVAAAAAAARGGDDGGGGDGGSDGGGGEGGGGDGVPGRGWLGGSFRHGLCCSSYSAGAPG